MHRPAPRRDPNHPNPAVAAYRPPAPRAPRDPLNASTRPQLRPAAWLDAGPPADLPDASTSPTDRDAADSDEPTIVHDGVAGLVAFVVLVVALLVLVLWVLPYLVVG